MWMAKRWEVVCEAVGEAVGEVVGVTLGACGIGMQSPRPEHGLFVTIFGGQEALTPSNLNPPAD